MLEEQNVCVEILSGILKEMQENSAPSAFDVA